MIDREHAERQRVLLAEQHDELRPYIVYRLFDWDSDVVYVGVTMDLAQRVAQHARDQRWWIDIDLAVIVTDEFATLDGAADFEELLIRERQPRYNSEGVGRAKYRRYGSNARAQDRAAA
jgi:predicted GIY-YIG superfamily endonuclease